MEWITLNHGAKVRWCDANEPPSFPDYHDILDDPAGLIQIGGDLTPEWLLTAYRRGIFPWFSQGDPILWWCPNPRTVLYPTDVIVRRSLAKVLRNGGFHVTMDTCFLQVIEQCAQLRADEGTWILPDMQSAYHQLHQLGMAHSVEVWLDGKLVGGLYGVALGRMFFGESMFSTVSNASKVALVYLCRQLSLWEFAMIDCQFSTDHLRSMGAVECSRNHFLTQLSSAVDHPTSSGAWTINPDTFMF